MNRYLISVRRYFSGEETFEVNAENKNGAIKAANELFTCGGEYGFRSNYDPHSLKVVKKLKPRKELKCGTSTQKEI